MFTGIITDIGTIRRLEDGAMRRLEIGCGFDMAGVAMGASIACSGVCLTVVEKGADWFAAEVSNETLDKTTAGRWAVGTRLNLERALKLGDELGGHLVAGHVDGIARLLDVREDGGSHRLTLEAPEGQEKFVAPKGSVALDGISLTVNEVAGRRFGVNIIPHTWSWTTLSTLSAGDPLNFEADLMARYAARLLTDG
jgi:riboflavin synthase